MIARETSVNRGYVTSMSGMSSLIRDIRDSFKSKGLEYISVAEAPGDSKKTVLTYKDGSGRILTKEIGISLSDMEETLREIDVIDPDDLANYLLG
jgi:hypothetical protein